MGVAPTIQHCPVMEQDICALLLHDRRGYDRLRHLGRTEVALPLLGAAAVLQVWSSFGLPPLVVPLYTLAVAALLICLIVSPRASTGLLARRPLIYIGAISYGLYLTHQLGLGISETFLSTGAWYSDLAVLATGLGLSIALCAVLHRWIELPMIGSVEPR